MNWSSPPFLYIKFRKIHVDATENSKDSKIKEDWGQEENKQPIFIFGFCALSKGFRLDMALKFHGNDFAFKKNKPY